MCRKKTTVRVVCWNWFYCDRWDLNCTVACCYLDKLKNGVRIEDGSCLQSENTLAPQFQNVILLFSHNFRIFQQTAKWSTDSEGEGFLRHFDFGGHLEFFEMTTFFSLPYSAIKSISNPNCSGNSIINSNIRRILFLELYKVIKPYINF